MGNTMEQEKELVRRFELPVWPGRGENGLGERERGIINKFLDLVQEDIHNHTFTEENNR